jgi:hypothetical protein
MQSAIHTLFAGLTLALVANAQIPLPSFGNTYTAPQTRGFCFTAPFDFAIEGLRVPNEAAMAFQVVEVIDFGTSAVPAYPGAVGTQLFYSNSVAAGTVIPCAITIPAGHNIGILGACTSAVGDPTSYNSYAATAGPFTSSLFGSPLVLTRFGTQSGIASNGGNQPSWQEPSGPLARVEVFVSQGMPLPPFGSTFASALTRGFWFQAPVDLRIEGLRVPNEAAQPFQVVEVIDFGTTPPPVWSATGTGTQLFYDNASAAGTVIPCSLQVPAGHCIGILGACTATVGDPTSHNSYAATAGPFTSTVLGQAVTLTRFGTQSGIAANGGNQPCWQEPGGNIARVEVFVTPAIPLPNFGNTYTANQTRGFWFQAPIDFTIEGLRVPNEAGQAYQVVEVVSFGGSLPPVYPAVANGAQLFYSNSTAAGSVIPCSIPIPAGAHVGILGACTATLGSATSYNSYAATSGPVASSILGSPVTLTRFGTQTGIASNGGNQPCFQTPTGPLSRVDVYVGPVVGHRADWQAYGTGCVDRASATFYEAFAPGTFDLVNASIRLVPTGNGYLAMAGSPLWWTPVGANLGLTDDSVSGPLSLGFTLNYPGGSTTDVYASSNGFVWAQASIVNGCCTGDPTQFVAGGARWSLLWNDLNPSSGGTIVFDQDPANGAAYLTYTNVPEYSAGNPNTFQIAFFANGVVEYRWQSCSITVHTALTGWTPGASQDPGSIDLSTGLPIVTQPDLRALALASSARPILGTAISLDTTNVPVSCVIGATMMGLIQWNPGLDLTGIGMPGCYQYLDIIATSLWFPGGTGGSTPFQIPLSSAYAGMPMFGQSAAMVPGINLLGVVSSNGVMLTLDFL